MSREEEIQQSVEQTIAMMRQQGMSDAEIYLFGALLMSKADGKTMVFISTDLMNGRDEEWDGTLLPGEEPLEKIS